MITQGLRDPTCTHHSELDTTTHHLPNKPCLSIIAIHCHQAGYPVASAAELPAAMALRRGASEYVMHVARRPGPEMLLECMSRT
jgi:hypothetical protein